MKRGGSKKFDGVSGLHKDQTPEQEHVSSSDAMDEYFFDMLGSVADQQPLKKYQDDSNFEHSKSSTQSIDDPLEKLSLKPKTKVIAKAEFAAAEVNKPRFAEPEKAKISPLIIPAAFPKLAPVKTEPETQTKVEEKVEVKADVKNKQALKSDTQSAQDTLLSQDTRSAQETKAKQASKLDRKTALKILEKKKSKLTAAQLARLEAKLGVKSQTGTQTSEAQSAKVKQAVKTDVKQASETKTKPEVKVEPKVEAKVETRLESKPEVSDKAREKVAPIITPGEPGQAGPPSWAQDRFECLIFSVAGLKLAVPLISLGAIYKIEKEFTPIVGRAEYFMGLYNHLDRNIRVVDTAQWVMPDRWTPEAREGYHFIIRLGGNNWGLACDSVHESIQLETDMVKWRSERTTRGWLSGTVIGHMCALLDADVLTEMLEEKASRNGSSFS